MAVVAGLEAWLGREEGRGGCTAWSGLAHPAYFLKPGCVGLDRPFGRHVVVVNAQGNRGAAVVVRKPGVGRILVLGDSVVFGSGVGEGGTLPVKLGELLGSGWEVVNAGVPSYNVWDYEGWLARRLSRFEPDIVVLGITRNDFARRGAHSMESSPAGGRAGVIGHAFNFALRSSIFRYLLVKWNITGRGKYPLFGRRRELDGDEWGKLESAYAGDDRTVLAVAGYLRDYRLAPGPILNGYLRILRPEHWQPVGAVLARIAGLCRRRGVKLLAVQFPLQFEVYPGYRWSEPSRLLGGMLSSSGIPSLDLTAAFANTGKGDELYAGPGDPCHFSLEGNLLAAKAVAWRLLDLGWLQQDPFLGRPQ